jgi:hypothetical protein
MHLGRYNLDVNFGQLSEQKELLNALTKVLGSPNRQLLSGLVKLLDTIELQETTTDTAVPKRQIKGSYVSAAQLTSKEQTSKQ